MKPQAANLSRPSSFVLRPEVAVLVSLALLKLLLHLCLNGRYGYMRDELYFMECGRRLALGYVDIGPLTPWLWRLTHELLGDSLLAVRLPSALAGALTVFLTGWLARYLGGGRFAQFLAAFAVIIAPVWLQTGNILALPSFEPLLWLICICLMAVLFKTGRRDLWVWVGVAVGIGFLSKPSVAFLAIGLGVGLLLTAQRKYLLDKWLWFGVLIALAIVLPNLIWQAQNDWPTWEFLHGMNRDLMSRIPRWLFLLGQVIYQHPLNAPIWIAGLIWFLAARDGRPYRAFGWAYLVVLALLLVAHSKIYYLAPAYPMLLAAGGVAIEASASRRQWRWPKVVLPAVLVLGGLVTAPLGLPILSIQRTDAYVGAMTFGAFQKVYEITGTWHDQFGWENQVTTVADVFSRLTPAEKADCMILVGNFGQAGALDFFGPARGLPHPTCVHQNYFFWGAGPASGQLAIVYGLSRDMVDFLFGQVEIAATIRCAECMPYENNLPVYVCRKPLLSIKDAWPVLRLIAFSNTGVSPAKGIQLRDALSKYRAARAPSRGVAIP